MKDSCYQFSAVRGIQAGREYYVAMCPLKVIPRLLVFDDDEVPADMRAQRTLNRARVPEIARYIVNNVDDYVLSAITACIDGEVRFEPFAVRGEQRNIGCLYIDMKSRILVNDGQHRRAAIAEALKQTPSLGEETISVVFYLDAGLKRSQQWFSDLNQHSVRPTRSLGILYDGREPMSHLVRDLMSRVALFDKSRTELEKTTVSNRSTKLFTVSAIYQATSALLSKKRKHEVSKDDLNLATSFWCQLATVIPEWSSVIKDRMTSYSLRCEYIHGHGVALQALGIAGQSLIEHAPKTWQQDLEKITIMDWQRSNPLWSGRAIIRGKLSKSRDSVLLTASAIKTALELELTPDEAALEDQLKIERAQ